MQTLPFQIDRPVFVRIPFKTRNKIWEHGEHLPWKEMNMEQERVQIMYNTGSLYHSDEQEISMQVGDGLEAIDIVGLHQIVDDYNARVKAIVGTNTNLMQRRKCPMSKLATKQRGLIRSWRRNNLDWLEKSEANK